MNRSFYLLFSVLLSPINCIGDTVVLQEGVAGYSGTTDASLYQDRPDNSNGGHAYVYVGMTLGASLRRGLFRFDLTGHVPAGAVVTTGALRLVVDQSRPSSEPHTIHRALALWGEGTTNGPDPGGLGIAAAPGDATWNSAAHQQTLWTTPGADFTPTSSADAVAGPLGSSVTFTGDGLVQDLQAWVQSPAANHGWVLRGNEVVAHNARRFVSSEGTLAARPQLTVTFTPPSGIRDWTLY